MKKEWLVWTKIHMKLKNRHSLFCDFQTVHPLPNDCIINRRIKNKRLSNNLINPKPAFSPRKPVPLKNGLTRRQKSIKLFSKV